jgi:hypothetical protein
MFATFDLALCCLKVQSPWAENCLGLWLHAVGIQAG